MTEHTAKYQLKRLDGTGFLPLSKHVLLHSNRGAQECKTPGGSGTKTNGTGNAR